MAGPLRVFRPEAGIGIAAVERDPRQSERIVDPGQHQLSEAVLLQIIGDQLARSAGRHDAARLAFAEGAVIVDRNGLHDARVGGEQLADHVLARHGRVLGDERRRNIVAAEHLGDGDGAVGVARPGPGQERIEADTFGQA
ncbi:hypothetical protein LP420_04830 [Massilia sp. B-10]|nr:hypothetical protein LP420_04830 [Massilia sp. B-10]